MNPVQTTPSPGHAAADAFKSPKPSRLPPPGGNDRSPVMTPPLTPLTIPASPFMQKLGCGTGVNVYLLNRAAKPNQSPWAVKKVSGMGDSRQVALFQKRLCEEAEILKDLKHPNIVGFRALTRAKDGSSCLAMEYGGEQSLNDLIEARREGAGPIPFPAPVIEKVALHVARGLQYLHSEKKLLHGDIKSCNVVIKGDFETVKICDVGVSLPLDENMAVADPDVEYVGTEPWNAKEVMLALEITDKTDIFAYGLTLWEMMTLMIPHVDMLVGDDDDDDDDDDESMEEEDFDEDAYYERVGTRPPLDADSLGGEYQKVVALFCLCTEEDPAKRPSAAQIVQALESNAPIS